MRMKRPHMAAIAIGVLLSLMTSACGTPHDDVFAQASPTPIPLLMIPSTVTPGEATPQTAAPTPSSTPTPLPTLVPATAPDELYAVSFMDDRAVFAVYGLWKDQPGVRFFDLEQSPYEDGDGYMVPAAQVLRSLGYTVDREDEQGLEAHSATSALVFETGSAAYLQEASEHAIPQGVSAPVWTADCLWVSTLILPLPATIGRDEHMLTFDASEKNNASGREAAAETGLSLWGAYPK